MKHIRGDSFGLQRDSAVGDCHPLGQAVMSVLFHCDTGWLKPFVVYMRIICKSASVIMLNVYAAGVIQAAGIVDLSQSAVITVGESVIVGTAQRMLTEEIAKRTGINLSLDTALGDEMHPVILLCQADNAPESLKKFIGTMDMPGKVDAFAIAVRNNSNPPIVVLAGHDERGVLFASGRLLLKLRMSKGKIELPADYRIATAPHYPHRGHQISYRALAHCYDAWTPGDYDQYMREMSVFGANAFETTSFGDPGNRDGPHSKVTNGEMAAAWSEICAGYGFDYWLFTEAVGGQGKSDEQVLAAIKSRLNTLRAIPHVDHLYLTGGDGGSAHRRPDLMIERTGRLAMEAREIHPGLGIWISNQGFPPELNNWFFDYLQREQPDWITGIVYGAWSRILLDEQRARVPAQYPIRRYPDIGHCVRAQYPVPGWDRTLAQTLGREPFAPRPRAHARIHNLFDQYADGFVTYSDGVGDDVNKVVWTALGWDPSRNVDDIMLDYARFFFGWDIGETVREGLFMLEDNFAGSLAENRGVEKTFALWKTLEDNAGEALLSNWRFQECLLRAYYDHYTRLRLLKANAIEKRACAVLGAASQVGVEKTIANARAIMAETDQGNCTNKLKERIKTLGAELFESIGAQLDVKTYKAAGSERGAVLDFLDTPLNNRLWLEHEFDAILNDRFSASMPDGPKKADTRLARLARVANWENPGLGGYYDDLGCAWKQPHLIKPKPLWDDPAGITTPREDHSFELGSPSRLSWLDVSEGLYETPLILRYDNLDPDSTYRVRVTYLGRYGATIRLVANSAHEIHGAYGHTLEGVRYTSGYSDGPAVIDPAKNDQSREVAPLEFVIPRKATQEGTLELTWQRVTGRGVQVAEVWLIKQ
mgnify:FL=1|jgi:hypothetical protein|tara:strand:- start:296 stop:2923 length:2628 start_codon:yes stop_codon:yes gene_type:complete